MRSLLEQHGSPVSLPSCLGPRATLATFERFLRLRRAERSLEALLGGRGL